MIRKLTIVTTVSIMTARIGARRRMRPHLKVADHLCHGSRSVTERIMAEIDMRKSRDEVQLHAQEDLHHARPRRAAALPAGVWVLCHLCGRVRRALGGIHDWLVLLVHVGGHWHGGDHRRGCLCSLLVSWSSPMDPGINNPGPS